MRSILTVLIIAGFAAPAFAAEPDLTQQQGRAKWAAEAYARCQYQVERAARVEPPKGPIQLADAPAARMERAVNRRINGCPAPVIVRHDVEKK